MRSPALAAVFPWLRHLGRYDRGMLRDDVVAGVTTAVMLIPQAMAYALLAGLPPIIGLYASTLPLFVYALFGTSRQLAVGPVAMDSLLVASAVGALAVAGSDDAVRIAIVLALMVGVVQTVLGTLRGGFLVNFLARPVVRGFTSAAAFLIGFGQLGPLLGLALPRSDRLHEMVPAAFDRFAELHPVTAGLGIGSAIGLLALRKWWPRGPAALVIVGLATLAVSTLDLAEGGVAIVGSVPSGLPEFAWPSWDLSLMGTLWPAALTLALVGFMEAISAAQTFATAHRYALAPNRELVALGLANLAGALVRGYPVTGGLSRTAVNDRAGARTQLAGAVTGITIVLALSFLTALLHDIPNAALAAVIITAALGLVDVREVERLWRVDRSDLALLVITFAATLGLGMQQGIAAGVGASLLFFVVRTTQPHLAVLGRVPGTEVHRNIRRFPDATRTPGVLALRIDAQFYFGNVEFLHRTIARLVYGDPSVRAVVIDAASINRLDSSAEAALRSILLDLRGRGMDLRFASVKGPVRDVMDRSGLTAELGSSNIHLTVEDAVQAAARSIDDPSRPRPGS